MSERTEKTVTPFQKWCLKNFRWAVLVVVVLNIADLAFGSHQEPVSYWLNWFCVVSGIIVLIQWPSNMRKIEKVLAERERAKNGGTP
jgi:hypothetical protein